MNSTPDVERWQLKSVVMHGRFRGWQVWRGDRPMSALFETLPYAYAALVELQNGES